MLSFDILASILKLANKYGIIVIADEIYQYNVIKDDIHTILFHFHSMKKKC